MTTSHWVSRFLLFLSWKQSNSKEAKGPRGQTYNVLEGRMPEKVQELHNLNQQNQRGEGGLDYGLVDFGKQ